MILKIVYNKDVHLFVSTSNTSFESLQNYIGEVFQHLPAQYHLIYYDDLDPIILGCQSDFQNLQLLEEKYDRMYINIVRENLQNESNQTVLDRQREIQSIELNARKKNLVSRKQHVASLHQIGVGPNQGKSKIANYDKIDPISKNEKLQKSAIDQSFIIAEEKFSIEESNSLETKSWIILQQKLNKTMATRFQEDAQSQSSVSSVNNKNVDQSWIANQKSHNIQEKQQKKMEAMSQYQNNTNQEEKKSLQMDETRIEKKSEGMISENQVDSRKVEVTEVQKQTNKRVIQNFKYLIEYFQGEVQEQKCYDFAKNHPTLQKGQLISLYSTLNP